ncbi:MAG TPA: glycosyltransferase [Halomicronema sp.]
MTLFNYPKIEPVVEVEKRPFWSVMIPTYNNSKYLEKALESILKQDPGPDEMQIEVIDDCSTKDDPEEIVKKIGKNRVTFHRQPQNLGIGGNWNSCLQRTRGKWVHILHQDDFVMPGFYSRFKESLEKNSDVGAAFCRNIYVDENNNWKGFSSLEKNTAGILENWIEKIGVECCMVCPAIVVKRSVYENLGGFHPKLVCALDWDMWKRIALHYPIWYEPQVLAGYRWHPISTSSRLILTATNISDARQAIEISRAFLPAELIEKSCDHHAIFAFYLAGELLRSQELAGALAQIQEGLKCSQSQEVMQRLGALLASPEGLPVLKILAKVFLNFSE